MRKFGYETMDAGRALKKFLMLFSLCCMMTADVSAAGRADASKCTFKVQKKGGNRQVLHEIIRQCSMEAAERIKNGEDQDLISMLVAKPEFCLKECDLTDILNPAAYTGRCAEQVSQYLHKLEPLLRNVKEAHFEIEL